MEKCLIIDFDDTLVKTIEIHADSWRKALEKVLKIEIPLETKLDTVNILDLHTKIPKILHFIYFGYTEFTFIHYLSIKTAYDHNPNYKIYLYNYNLNKAPHFVKVHFLQILFSMHL